MCHSDPMHILDAGTDVPDPVAPYLEVDRTRPHHECWVIGHMVSGLDGTAAVDNRVGALSTRPDQEFYRAMRQVADVVMIGAETVRREGFGAIRLSEAARAWRREQGMAELPPVAVVSRSLDLPWHLKLFQKPTGSARTHVLTCANADPERLAAAREVAEVIIAGEDRVDPVRAMTELAARGHTVVMCEGGPTWLGEVVAADRLDELLLSISPMMGGDPLPVAITPQGAGMHAFDLRGVMREEDTIFLRYTAARQEAGQP